MPAAIAVPAIVGTLGAGASVASSLIGKSATGQAVDAQTAQLLRAEQIANSSVAKGQELATGAQGDANRGLSDAVQAQLQLYAPYIQAGSDTLPTLKALAGAGGPLDQTFSFGQKDLDNDPGYQFTLQQGQQAIQRAQAAKGNLFSTGTLKSLAGFTTGTANQYFNDAYNRAANTFNINRSTALSRIGTLQGLAGLGFSGTSAADRAIGSGASQIAGNTFRTGQFNADLGLQGARIATGLAEQQGNVQAAGRIGGANAITSGIGGVANSISNGLLQGLTLRQLANYGGGGGGFTPYASATRTWNPSAGGGGLPTISGIPGTGGGFDLSTLPPITAPAPGAGYGV